ncbi:MAG: hypothetical protein HQL98_15660 [Magnetococcales bacterium]|nr:hypothetical protein [Magnetococcales bacterium]
MKNLQKLAKLNHLKNNNILTNEEVVKPEASCFIIRVSGVQVSPSLPKFSIHKKSGYRFGGAAFFCGAPGRECRTQARQGCLSGAESIIYLVDMEHFCKYRSIQVSVRVRVCLEIVVWFDFYE